MRFVSLRVERCSLRGVRSIADCADVRGLGRLDLVLDAESVKWHLTGRDARFALIDQATFETLASLSSVCSSSSVILALSSWTAGSASDELSSSIGSLASESEPALSLNDASESESISSSSESSESSELAEMERPSSDLRRLEDGPFPPLLRFLPLPFFFCRRRQRSDPAARRTADLDFFDLGNVHGSFASFAATRSSS